MSETEFDAIVLGAGAPGEVCAGRLGDGGLSVAIVEQHLIGGECSYYACMPSKALLRPGELLHEIERVPGVRELVSGELDPELVLAGRPSCRDRHRDHRRGTADRGPGRSAPVDEPRGDDRRARPRAAADPRRR